uniref:Uncharacterized protein n=1 Tax=Paramoeba aestuarina TaxID=180227 RepID=A0A7S4KRC5_9EUKA|mmetsp:Transcript_23907/g.37235  ORF Transcript_23907/g.37235 Transcript_23907/m.37235 type:complete len:428 (+) Transcript_23907:1-1284(+)
MEVSEGDIVMIMPSENDIFSYPALNLQTGEEGKLRKTNIIETFMDNTETKEPPATIISVEKSKEKKDKEKKEKEREKKERRKTLAIPSNKELAKEKEKEREKEKEKEKAAKAEKKQEKERAKQEKALQDELAKGGGSVKDQLAAQVKKNIELTRQIRLHSCVIYSLSTELYQLQVKCQEQQKLLDSLKNQGGALPPPLPPSPLPSPNLLSLPQPQHLPVPSPSSTLTTSPVGKRASSPLPPPPTAPIGRSPSPLPPQLPTTPTLATMGKSPSPLPPQLPPLAQSPPINQGDEDSNPEKKANVLRRSTSFDTPTLSLPPPPPPISRERGETVGGIHKTQSYSPTALSPPSSPTPTSPSPVYPQLSMEQCEIMNIIKKSLKTKNSVPFPFSHVDKLLSEQGAHLIAAQVEDEGKVITRATTPVKERSPR